MQVCLFYNVIGLSKTCVLYKFKLTWRLRENFRSFHDKSKDIISSYFMFLWFYKRQWKRNSYLKIQSVGTLIISNRTVKIDNTCYSSLISWFFEVDVLKVQVRFIRAPQPSLVMWVAYALMVHLLTLKCK